jgi:glycosyltransferase involved in cell wall biosynthesis
VLLQGPSHHFRNGAGQEPKLRVIHTIASTEQEASGPSYSVPRLATEQARFGHHVELITTGAGGVERIDGYRHSRFPQDLARVPVVRSMVLSSATQAALREAARRADIIHNHGLWLMPNVYCAQAAKAAGLPLVMAPRGMLGPGALQFSRWKKRLFWLLLQRRAAESVACWHATSEKEYEDIRGFGLRQPVAIVENGIDLPPPPEHAESPEKRVLYLGRVHPKKGIENLVAAWSKLEPQFPEWSLDIAGPDEGGHGATLRAQARKFQCRRIGFLGPVLGEEKFALYRRAGLFVLPTRDENFGMTVAEALSVGTPVICTKGAPWSGLGENGCGWWIDHGVEPLAEALRIAMSLPPERRQEMGAGGREWMGRDFSWSSIARRMAELYGWLAGAGDRPTFVHAD